MNSIYKALGAAALAIGMCGCGDDFLNVTSPTQPSSDEYFSEKTTWKKLLWQLTIPCSGQTGA